MPSRTRRASGEVAAGLQLKTRSAPTGGSSSSCSARPSRDMLTVRAAGSDAGRLGAAVGGQRPGSGRRSCPRGRRRRGASRRSRPGSRGSRAPPSRRRRGAAARARPGSSTAAWRRDARRARAIVASGARRSPRRLDRPLVEPRLQLGPADGVRRPARPRRRRPRRGSRASARARAPRRCPAAARCARRSARPWASGAGRCRPRGRRPPAPRGRTSRRGCRSRAGSRPRARSAATPAIVSGSMPPGRRSCSLRGGAPGGRADRGPSREVPIA